MLINASSRLVDGARLLQVHATFLETAWWQVTTLVSYSTATWSYNAVAYYTRNQNIIFPWAFCRFFKLCSYMLIISFTGNILIPDYTYIFIILNVCSHDNRANLFSSFQSLWLLRSHASLAYVWKLTFTKPWPVTTSLIWVTCKPADRI